MIYTLSGYDARPFARNKNPGNYHPIMCKILSAEAKLTRGTIQIAYNLPCRLRMNDSPGFARHWGFIALFAQLEFPQRLSAIMDPASAASLGVGVASQAFDAFDRSVKGQY